MKRSTSVALLIDAENASAKSVELVLNTIAEHGVAHVRRAYGNWKNPSLQQWEARLHDLAIRPVQQFSYTSAKNASDMAMVIDAMDLMYSGDVDSFALMSSDGDFTPLVMRLRASGKNVLGFGEKKTPAPFVNACSQFTLVDGVQAPPGAGPAPTPQPWPAKRLRADARLVTALRSAVSAAKGGDGWSDLAAVGSRIQQQGTIEARQYGYSKLIRLIEVTELFEVRRAQHGCKVRCRP